MLLAIWLIFFMLTFPPHRTLGPDSCSSVLMFSKEFIKDSCLGVGMSPTTAGFVSGAGGGVCQVSVMGPCTFLVTSMVTGGKQTSLTSQIRSTWQAKVRRRQEFVSYSPRLVNRQGDCARGWIIFLNRLDHHRVSGGFTRAALQLPFGRPPIGQAAKVSLTPCARVGCFHSALERTDAAAGCELNV